MRSPTSVGALFLLFLFAPACGGGTSTTDDDRALAALVPAHTVAWLRVASLEALTAPAREVAAAVGEDATPLSADRLLAQLGGLAGDTQWIDLRRPFAIALCAPKATPPTPVFLVPATDPAKYAASLQGRGLTPVVDGGYVVITMGGKYGKPAAPSQLADGLPVGVLSLRVDVEKVAANLGVPIGAALTAFKAVMAGEMQRANSGIDGEAIADLYVDAVRAVLASTSRLDVSADYGDGRLQFLGSMMAKAGSDMDGWSSAPVDLSTFEGRPSGKGSLELVMAADWAKLWPRLEALTMALFDACPEPVRKPMRDLMAGYLQAYESAGPVLAADGDLFGEDGMHLVLHAAPPDSKVFLSTLETLMARPELEQVGAKITSVGSADVEGATARDYLMKFDVDKLLGEPAGNAAAQPQAAAVFQRMFGSDGLPLRIAAKGGRAVMTVGKPRQDVASSFAVTGGSWSAATRLALQQVADCNPLLVERLDMAALMGGMAKIMAAGATTRPMPELPAGSSADFVMSMGIRGSEWRFGLAFDVVGFSKMMKAMMPR